MMSRHRGRSRRRPSNLHGVRKHARKTAAIRNPAFHRKRFGLLPTFFKTNQIEVRIYFFLLKVGLRLFIIIVIRRLKYLNKKLYPKGPFPLRAWKRAFFVSFIDLRLKRAQKENNKTNKECFFPRS